jgi:hypothetical protein
MTPEETGTIAGIIIISLVLFLVYYVESGDKKK